MDKNQEIQIKEQWHTLGNAITRVLKKTYMKQRKGELTTHLRNKAEQADAIMSSTLKIRKIRRDNTKNLPKNTTETIYTKQ